MNKPFILCLLCNAPTSNKKFCSSSCSAKFSWKNSSYAQAQTIAHQGQVAWNKGVPISQTMSKEVRKNRRMCISNTLKKKYSSGERKPHFLGKKHSEEHKQKISTSLIGKQAGSKNWNWKGGATPINKLLRNSREFALWRKAVFERDQYACRTCGKGGELHPHHIKEFSKHPESRFDVNNGLTLCPPCHSFVHRRKI